MGVSSCKGFLGVGRFLVLFIGVPTFADAVVGVWMFLVCAVISVVPMSGVMAAAVGMSARAGETSKDRKLGVYFLKSFFSFLLSLLDDNPNCSPMMLAFGVAIFFVFDGILVCLLHWNQ